MIELLIVSLVILALLIGAYGAIVEHNRTIKTEENTQSESKAFFNDSSNWKN